MDISLYKLKDGQSAVIESVGGEGALRQHLLDMGLIPGAYITYVKSAPMGDPIEYRVHGYELTLRIDDAKQVTCRIVEKKDIETNVSETEGDDGFKHVEHGVLNSSISHPGLGEGGLFHDKKTESPLPDETLLTFALVGNQNCGKTTLFNQLTGANQHVGNFPGVTVDRKDGAIRGRENTRITDLPGIYSMSPYSGEEIVSRDFVLKEKPKAIINIVDATNIERNLYLTMQLLEMNIPMVIALNMMDEVRGNGGYIDVNKMEQLLGVPVIPIAAVKNEGVEELIAHAYHIAKYQERSGRMDFCDENDHNGAVHRCLHAIIHLIEDHAKRADIPLRFAAGKLAEGDENIADLLKLDDNERAMIRHIRAQMETERGLDACAAMADMRYSFITKICNACVKKPEISKEAKRSSRIDALLTGKYTAIPIFVIIMAAVFILTFNVIGAFLQELLEAGIDKAAYGVNQSLLALDVNEALRSLIIDGIFTGVGTVVSFLPIIVTLFFFLSLLEDTGYMARVAFVMDKLLRKIGLSGRSIVPMLIGFGCTVPAVMATRTLPSERDRKMTILMTPFMSCSAKVPIYAFFVSKFFPGRGGLVMVGLYFLGILTGVIVALVYKGRLFKGEAVPFVMELPNYRMPSAKSVCFLLWEKAKDFLQKAFTIIFLATIVVWFLQSFNIKLNLVSDSSQSILAMVSGWLVPIFSPIGLGDWRICTSLISGFIAKESVVSTMEILFSEGVDMVLPLVSVISLLVFSLLYTPCVAAVSAIKRELGVKWAALVAFLQFAIAWVAAFLFYILFGMILK